VKSQSYVDQQQQKTKETKAFPLTTKFLCFSNVVHPSQHRCVHHGKHAMVFRDPRFPSRRDSFLRRPLQQPYRHAFGGALPMLFRPNRRQGSHGKHSPVFHVPGQQEQACHVIPVPFLLRVDRVLGPQPDRVLAVQTFVQFFRQLVVVVCNGGGGGGGGWLEEWW